MAPTDLVSSISTQSTMNSTTYNNNLLLLRWHKRPQPFQCRCFLANSLRFVFWPKQFRCLSADTRRCATIRILVIVNISALPYRTSLILGYADSPSISVSDLISTVALYFDMSTAMAKWEVESAFVSIRVWIFNVVNMPSVGFLDSTGKSITMYRAQL